MGQSTTQVLERLLDASGVLFSLVDLALMIIAIMVASYCIRRKLAGPAGAVMLIVSRSGAFLFGLASTILSLVVEQALDVRVPEWVFYGVDFFSLVSIILFGVSLFMLRPIWSEEGSGKSHA